MQNCLRSSGGDGSSWKGDRELVFGWGGGEAVECGKGGVTRDVFFFWAKWIFFA